MNVLVVDDEPMVRKHLGRAIERAWSDAHIAWASSLPEAERALDKTHPGVVTVDLALLPDRSKMLGLRLVERLAREGRAHRAIVMTGQGGAAVDAARRAGARVVLTKPFHGDDLFEAGRQMGIPLVGAGPPVDVALAALVGASPPMQRLREAVRRAASGTGAVLIQGETGTGKELVARAIHQLRGKGPFHALNCSALGSLAESQLFGHARGAFTSADRRARGAIEQAGDGVLFLDEIGDLERSLQPKLLRLLEGNPFQALGDEQWQHLQARLVAASHVDLEARVSEGAFREDLFYRLAVHVVHVPPLRDRAGDMASLARALLQRLPDAKEISADAVAHLEMRSWPGNIRQLAGFLERLAVQTDGDVIGVQDVLTVDRLAGGAARASRALAQIIPTATSGPIGAFHAEMDAHATALLQQALRETGGNVSAAAKLLGLDRMAMVRRMAKWSRG